MRASNKTEEQFIQGFQVPKVAQHIIHQIFTEQEIAFVAEHVNHQLNRDDYSDDFLKREYHRGLISYTDSSKTKFQISNFYNMLDVFVVSRKEEYNAFPPEVKKALDDWYFETYYQGLDTTGEEPPTGDEILPLEEVLAFIDAQERPIYLNDCDCRSLKGDCGFSTKTCITYKNGINTFADRGLSEEIDKTRAKEIVIQAEKEGLMHTANPNGICNCCGDCCYLFRGRERCNSGAAWPKTEHIIAVSEEKCIRCGICVKRCHMQVFEKIKAENDPLPQRITADVSRCVGCGICVGTCPGKALELIRR